MPAYPSFLDIFLVILVENSVFYYFPPSYTFGSSIWVQKIIGVQKHFIVVLYSEVPFRVGFGTFNYNKYRVPCFIYYLEINLKFYLRYNFIY